MKLLRPFFALGAVFVLLAACGGSEEDPKAGLALTITTDGSVSPDRLNLRVTSGTTIFLGTDIAIGSSATLPRTVNVDASGTATVVVKAWQGSTPLDRRDLVVGPLPATGYAPVTITLTSKCTTHVRAEGDDIVSDCAAGTTCSASDGSCGSTQVNPSVCTPGAITCADGQSTRKCKADGSGYEASVSCNGKTCAADACTACNIGDESCGSTPTKCTLGAFRCGAGKTLQRCQTDGSFKDFQECDYFCADDQCKGECGPGATRCCITYSDGSKACGGPGGDRTAEDVCVGGNCMIADAKKPTGVTVETCGSNALWTAPGASCSTNCTDGSDKITVGCGFCGNNGGGMPSAQCLPVCTCAD